MAAMAMLTDAALACSARGETSVSDAIFSKHQQNKSKRKITCGNGGGNENINSVAACKQQA